MPGTRLRLRADRLGRGLVPSWIIDQAQRGAGVEEHIKTVELDLGLSIVVLNDRLYEEIAGRLRDADFRPDTNPGGKPTTGALGIQARRHGRFPDSAIVQCRPRGTPAQPGGRLRRNHPPSIGPCLSRCPDGRACRHVAERRCERFGSVDRARSSC